MRHHQFDSLAMKSSRPEGGMTEVWLRAALWLGLALALLATLISIRLRIATVLSEIVVGTVSQLVIGAFIGTPLLGTTERWITFLFATGPVSLAFLAGAELDPAVLRARYRRPRSRRRPRSNWRPATTKNSSTTCGDRHRSEM